MIRDNNEENKNYEIIENSVSEYIEDLSIGISNLINIFEPEVIGIGGSFVHFEDVFLGRLRDKINKENEKIIGRENVLIKTAVLGNYYKRRKRNAIHNLPIMWKWFYADIRYKYMQ